MSKRKLSGLADVAVPALMISALWVSPSYAYLDPGTGSMLLTGILGIFAAITYTLRRFFYRLLRVFGIGGASRDTDED
jgi:hypothetical protein